MIKILPGLVPVIGSTEAEARALEARTGGAHHPRTRPGSPGPGPRGARRTRWRWTARCRPRCTPGADVRGAQSRYQLIVELARRDQLTVRQLIGRLGGGRGHRTFAGTPEQVADTIEEWSAAAAADGFNVMPPALPSGLETFVEHVIPILQKRGLARTEYTGTTLRDHYGLPRPDSQFAAPPAVTAGRGR